jgi:uncharacterized membrane protein
MSRMKKTNKYRWFKFPLEYAFLIIGLVFGLFFVFINPPFHTNDEDRHFLHAYFISEGKIIPSVKDNQIGGELPNNLVTIVKQFQGIPFQNGTKIDPNRMKSTYDIPLNPNEKNFYHDFHYAQNPIPYIPHSIGIMIGRIINSNPVRLGWFGRIGGLLCYLLIVFLAIRITPIFKSVIFLYSLTPMVLYQGASVTYDMLSNALTFLLVAVFLQFALEKEGKLSTKEFILIILLAILHRFSKDGYILIPFLFFIIPPKKIGSPLKMIAMAVILLFVYYIPNFTWVKIINGVQIAAPPLLKKDFIVDPGQNLALNLTNPVNFIKNIFDNILHFRQEWTGGTIGRFGYSYTLLPTLFFIIHGLVLLIVAFLDSNEKFFLKVYQKLIIFLIGFGMLAILIIGFYIQSPVGASMVFGFQGRYLIPVVPFLFLLLYNNKFEIQNWIKWKNIIISLYIILALAYSVIYLNNAMYE